MRITSKGQVTIPASIRQLAGFLPRTEVDFRFEGSAVTIFKSSPPSDSSRGERLVAHLKGKGDVNVTTDEIMALTRGD